MKNRTLDYASILFFLLLVGLFHQGCNVSRIPEQAEIKYDIQGDWEISTIKAGRIRVNRICTFVGSKKSGTVVPEEGEAGTYKAGGEHGTAVEFFFWTYDDDGMKVFENYRGNFIDENFMEGTGNFKREEDVYGSSIAWGAYRIGGRKRGQPISAPAHKCIQTWATSSGFGSGKNFIPFFSPFFRFSGLKYSSFNRERINKNVHYCYGQQF